MRLFVSYARRDREGVDGLVSDLERSGHAPWFDREIGGGQRWWDTLLEQIRACDALVFAVSPESVASRACRAELTYATAVARPLLPVMLRDTNVDLAPDPIGLMQIVDYRHRTSENAISLMAALDALGPAPPLRDLPPPPPPPIADLGPLRDAVASDALSYTDQQALLAELERRRDEVDQHDTLRELLHRLRDRADIVESVARGVDAALRRLPAEGAGDHEVATRTRRPLSERDPDSVDRLRSLLTHVRSGHFTPIIGHGLNDRLIGSPRTVAREWSRTFEFPMEKHRQDELPHVAQFISVMTNVETLRSGLRDYLIGALRQRYPEAIGEGDELDLGAALESAWHIDRSPTDPYLVLADLPCPVYINANPWNLLGHALIEAGRQPVTEVCRWRPDVYEWPPSILESEPGYVPTAERPLVYHVFGSVDIPDSLVLTVDDFDDFQIAVAENRSVIPGVVQRVLANSAMLLLGFDLEERDVRVLIRSLIAQQGAHRLSRYTHVAAQLEPTVAVTSPMRARRYLERYFSKVHQPSMDIFWGTPEEFTADLAELGQATR